MTSLGACSAGSGVAAGWRRRPLPEWVPPRVAAGKGGDAEHQPPPPARHRFRHRPGSTGDTKLLPAVRSLPRHRPRWLAAPCPAADSRLCVLLLSGGNSSAGRERGFYTPLLTLFVPVTGGLARTRIHQSAAGSLSQRCPAHRGRVEPGVGCRAALSSAKLPRGIEARVKAGPFQQARR